MVRCELCGKLLKTSQGLHGHRQFVHGIRNRDQLPVGVVATEQQLGKLDYNLGQAGDMIPMDTGCLAEQLEQYTKQLARFDEQLKSMSQQVRLVPSNTEVNKMIEFTEKFERKFKLHNIIFKSLKKSDIYYNKKKMTLDNNRDSINRTNLKEFKWWLLRNNCNDNMYCKWRG